MVRYITCDSDLNFPIPSVAQVADRISQLHNGHRPVTAQLIARSFGVQTPAIQAVLDRGRRNCVLHNNDRDGWIVLRA